jgi:predicted dehydrogenase
VPHAVQSLKAGKHVFIEKPMAITLGGADEIDAARKESGKLVFVGYMRQYAEAFLRVKEMVRDLPKGAINYVRVRDIIGYVRAGVCTF